MATNLVYRNSDSQNRVEDLGATIAPGTPVLSKAGLPAVAVTGSADYTKTESEYGMTVTFPAGGVGLKNQEVTLAFDGTWEFDDITGADEDTAQGAAVYIDSSGDLTTSSGGGAVEFGYVDWSPGYDKSRGFVPVRIGA